jgi:hypothetical protein
MQLRSADGALPPTGKPGPHPAARSETMGAGGPLLIPENVHDPEVSCQGKG